MENIGQSYTDEPCQKTNTVLILNEQSAHARADDL